MGFLVIPLRDTIPSRQLPVVTWSLIAVNAAIFLVQLSLGPLQFERIVRLFGLIPARYTHLEWSLQVGLWPPEYLPFLTSMFLHGSLLHIAGNMWMLWLFGDNVEDRMGRARFALFYLLTGVAAGFTHCIAYPDSVVPTIGASGAVAGVLGAYFFLYPGARIIAVLPILFWPFFMELPAFTYILFWLLSQVIGATLSPAHAGGVAWWAHVGGFLAGALLLRPFLLPARWRPRRFQPDEYGLERAWRAGV
ncbi:MAG TPA: rhomboid family intramembrane serine protease [Candidatus Polarisedimenticolia bacterium]|nr:rhomboid family intramembrane serine protease [Candidatus Polarisedimenticolia bacterium]